MYNLASVCEKLLSIHAKDVGLDLGQAIKKAIPLL